MESPSCFDMEVKMNEVERTFLPGSLSYQESWFNLKPGAGGGGNLTTAVATSQ